MGAHFAAESSAAWWSTPSLWRSWGYSKDPSRLVFYKQVIVFQNQAYSPCPYKFQDFKWCCTNLWNMRCFWLSSRLCWGWSWVTGPGYLWVRSHIQDEDQVYLWSIVWNHSTCTIKQYDVLSHRTFLNTWKKVLKSKTNPIIRIKC